MIRYKCKFTKVLEENMGEYLPDLGLCKKFLAMRSKAKSIEEKIDKLYCIKIKNFCSKKGSIKTMKSHILAENICISYIQQ